MTPQTPPSTTAFYLVYATCPSQVAASELGQWAVESGLAACANIIAPIHSVFMWNDTLHQTEEAVLLLKTTEAQHVNLVASLAERHPYGCPCVIAIPIISGHPPFLNWVSAQTSHG